MKQKEINVFYACDEIDNYKPTLFAVDGMATREMIREAILDYDDTLEDEEDFGNLLIVL